jgi:membrane glycosyltransferase
MSRAETFVARCFAAVATLGACAYGAHEVYALLGSLGHNEVDVAVTALFIACFGWVTFGAATAIVGFYAMLFGRHMPNGAPLSGKHPRVALCMPIYHESPASVCAHVRTIAEDLVALGMAQDIDVFLLSDSTRAGAWLAEEAAWAQLASKLAGRVNVYYRKRPDNAAKKAGNLRDFCMRYGADYKYLVVLDADSIMTADTIAELIRRMESRPKAGLIQVPPVPVRRQTPFARLQQFAAAVYGPLWARGSSMLWRENGNYFGHNAIVRTDVFQKYCGLQPLSGRGAFSGLVLSHDFVEAALVRRAGYEVWLADDLTGSYEHCPTTVIDYAIRDRRWCQGNIQHLRIALAPGLHWSSRFHLLHGVMSYAAAPIWLAFVLLGLLAAAWDLRLEPVYFPDAKRTLFPEWPVYDFDAAYHLMWLSLGVLFGPRVLAMCVFLFKHRLGMKAAVATVLSTALEFVMSTLLSPGLMLFQSVFVLTTLFGEKVAWASQARDDRSVSWREALMRHGVHMFAALALATMGALVSDTAFYWQLPLVIGLALSPVLTVVTSWAWLGRVLERYGLLLTPEDRSRHPILSALDGHEDDSHDLETIDPKEALRDPAFMCVHAQVTALTGMLSFLPDDERRTLWDLVLRDENLSNPQWIRFCAIR